MYKSYHHFKVGGTAHLPELIPDLIQAFFRGLFVTALALGAYSTYGQVGPNCTHINASIGADDTARVMVSELVTNAAQIVLQGDLFDIEIVGSYGQRIYYVTGVDDMYEIAMYACPHIGRQLKVNVSLSGGTSGACWSYLTFKQGNGPVIIGRSKTVYCFDPLVQGGHIHDVPPQAMVPCRGTEDATFVADWITAFNCDAAALGMAANDTAKIIYREYEAYDKNGVRGAGYDTIYVLRLPQITIDNAFCPLRDTVYCGTGGKLGPYMVAGRMFEYGAMDLIDRHQAISFVETSFNKTTRQLEFKAAEFDPKCGVSVHVDAWPLGSSECSSQYKVNVEIKQTCWGTPGTYVGPGSSNTMTNFIETYHPKHWAYYRSLNTGIITAMGTNLVPADLSVFDGTLNRPNPLLKQVNSLGAMSYRLFSNFLPTATKYEYARMCVQIPTEGDFSFTIAGSDGVYGGYRLNGIYVPVSDGTYTLSLEPCDEFCFEDRGADITVSNLNWTETVLAAPLTMVAPGYWTCEFWVIDLDTLPPVMECDLYYSNTDSSLVHGDTLYIPAGSHECAAHTYLPPVYVHDDWSGVKFVKAMIPGIATVVFEKSKTEPYLFESHKQVKIPHGLPIAIYYEAYDSCHNLAYDTCYVKVKDYTRPVAVCDKGVIVGLSGKKVWVEASTFDEGSWDNCDVNLLLARRVDWWTACVDLCDDDYHLACYDEHDSIWCTDLEQDKHVDEVEAHYYKTMKWLKEDGRECSDLLWNAWQYDLCKKRTLECIEHPYPVDEHYFKKLLYELGCAGEFEGSFPTHEDIDEWDQIGGGWSDAVPFDCEDACKEVMVELLVVDYWCNWSKCWTWVTVEDKTPVQVYRDVEDRLDLTCQAYKQPMINYPGEDHPVSIEYLVELAKLGESEAYSQLDQLFGGYEKVWLDEYGNVPAPALGGYDDMTCQCSTFTKQEKVYDEHLGYIWKTIYYDSCWTKTRDVPLFFGQVVVNCGQAIQCEQSVWCNFDHCGQGYVYREWKFIPGCPTDPDNHYKPAHQKDTITRKQLIWVGSSCPLEKGMFTRPADVYVNTCGIDYDDAGNAAGVLAPAYTGQPEYLFDDDCRIVGISHQDKVFKIVGGDEACYKIVRTWYHIDWCYLGGKPENSTYWWVNPEYAGRTISWEQKIIVIDTVPPVCTFEEELETVEAAGCAYTLSQTVYVDDSCGALNYHYELFSIKGTGKVSIAYDQGELDGTNASFDITIPDLLTGSYQLKVRVTDECQNESYCIDEFDVITGKKPAAICITSLTAELTPMDLDQDGEIDTAMVTIWANEFDRSSKPACDSDSELSFRIEILDDNADDSFAGTSDSLVLGCDQVGTQQIRLWVIDEQGSFDYCDVLLVVQNNMGGCPEKEVAVDGLLRGNIATEEGNLIEQVDVNVTAGTMISSLVTGVDGAFNFDVPMNTLVTIQPTKNVNHVNGVSTMDLILLQKHITGSKLITSPYRLIASDINHDGFVNAIDLLEMRALILGETTEFANNTSWRFIVKDYEFKTTDPVSEEFPERFTINMDQPIMMQDFIGMKIGDLDLDSDLSRNAPRSGQPQILYIKDRKVETGEIIEVPVYLSEVQLLAGLQYTLEFDNAKLSLVGIDPNELLAVTSENFGWAKLKGGFHTVAFNAPAPMSGKNLQFYSMRLEVLKPGKLSDMITLNGKLTAAIAFLEDGRRSSISLNFLDSNIETHMRLYQNEPNPAYHETSINFFLPNSTTATMTLYDLNGKVLQKESSVYAAGQHSIVLNTEVLSVKGVVYYELSTETDKITRKMIIH